MKINSVLSLVFLLGLGACSVKEQASNTDEENQVVVPNSEYDYPAGLHPNAISFLKKSPPRNYDSLEVADIRAGLKGISNKIYGGAQPGTAITNDTIRTEEADIPVRIYVSETVDRSQPLPALVYYHGGAWCLGGLDMVDFFGTSITQKIDIVVISVDYRLAPEYPFPAGLNDCYAALEWAVSNAETLGIDKNQISVGGGSAGGNLATVVAMKARDESGPVIKSQLLIYPATDLYNLNSYSYQTFGQNFGLAKGLMSKTINAYIPNKESRKHSYASPSMADSLAYLPPSLIITAEFDPLRDEGEAYAKLLEKAGNTVKLSRYDSMVHGFVTFAKVYPRQSNQAIEELGTYLEEN